MQLQLARPLHDRVYLLTAVAQARVAAAVQVAEQSPDSTLHVPPSQMGVSLGQVVSGPHVPPMGASFCGSPNGQECTSDKSCPPPHGWLAIVTLYPPATA